MNTTGPEIVAEKPCSHETEYVGMASVIRTAMTTETVEAVIGKYELTRISSILRQPSATRIRSYVDDVEGTIDLLDQSLEDQTGQRPNEEMSFGALAAATMHMARMFDVCQVKTTGQGGNSSAANALVHGLIDNLTWEYATKYYQNFTDGKPAWLKHQVDIGMRMQEHDTGGVGWYGTKVSMAASAAESAISTLNILESTEVMTDPETEALAQANDRLFAETKRLQKYGVKSAIAPALGAAPAVREWLFQARQDYADAPRDYSDDPTRYTMNEALAVVFGSDFAFTTSKPQAEVNLGADEISQSVSYNLEDMLEYPEDKKSPLFANLQLTKDGEIKTIWGADLKERCAKLGCSASYEQLRSELLTIYFDLVTPVYVQEVVDQEVASSQSPEAETKTQRLRRMVVARAVVLNALGSDVEDAIKGEIEAEAAETAQRNIHKHPVIGHIRNIKSTFQASPEARALCMKDLGIVLADRGETYVRNHERGNIENDDQGHKLSYGLGSAATQAAKQHRIAGRRNSRYTPPKKSARSKN